MPDLNNLFNSILKDPESQPLEVPEHLESERLQLDRAAAWGAPWSLTPTCRGTIALR